MTSSLDFLTQPEIVAGPEGKGGAGALAGLSIPVRIENNLHLDLQARDQVHVLKPRAGVEDHQPDRRRVAEEAQGQAGGRGHPRGTGGVRINERNNGGGGQNAKPPANQERPDEEGPPEESDQGRDPDLDNILR